VVRAHAGEFLFLPFCFSLRVMTVELSLFLAGQNGGSVGGSEAGTSTLKAMRTVYMLYSMSVQHY
jgi:hypothetical protein